MANDFHAIEVQLLAWTKSTSRKGPTVTLLLQDDADVEWFETLTLAKGKTAGQLLDAAFRLSPQDDQSREPVEKPKGGPLSQKAALLCQDEAFHAYVSQFGDMGDPLPPGRDWVEISSGWLRAYCGVSSRAELDHSPEAARRFAQLRTEFYQWRQGAR